MISPVLVANAGRPLKNPTRDGHRLSREWLVGLDGVRDGGQAGVQGRLHRNHQRAGARLMHIPQITTETNDGGLPMNLGVTDIDELTRQSLPLMDELLQLEV